MGYQARTRSFQFQGPQGSAGGSGGGGKFGGNIVGGSGGYGTGRGVAESRARAAKTQMFQKFAEGRKGPAGLQAQAQGLFSKQVLDPAAEASRAGETMASQQQQALRDIQQSRAVRTGDITSRGLQSASRALTGAGQRAMAGARADATRAADIANRQAQQEALRSAMAAQGMESPFIMREGEALGAQEFTTPDRMGGGFISGGGGGGGGAAYGGVLGASFNRPRRGRGPAEPDSGGGAGQSSAASRRRVASQHTPAQRKQAMAAGQAAVMGMFGFGAPSAPSGLSAAQKAANLASWGDTSGGRYSSGRIWDRNPHIEPSRGPDSYISREPKFTPRAGPTNVPDYSRTPSYARERGYGL